MKKIFILIIMLLLSVFLISCQENQLIDNTPNQTLVVNQTNARPDIERTHEATDMNEKTNINGTTDNQEIINPNQNVFINNRRSEIKFPLPIGFSFGNVYKTITKYDYTLLKPEAMMTGDGHFRAYDQLLRFDFKENTTGNISFVSENDYFGTALFFPENSPIFAYELNMEIPFFSDRVINNIITILGSDYLVVEANNFSLMLNGLNTERYLNIRDGDELITNNKHIKNTRAFYDGFKWGYEVYAEDIDDKGILLREGESLREKLSKKHLDDILLSEFFDIRYQGLEPLGDHVTITLKNHGNYVDLIWETPTNNMTIPLLGYNELGDLWYGGETNKIHFSECDCITFNDWVVIEVIINGEKVSKLLKFSSIDLKEKKLVFRDPKHNVISVDYDNNYAYLPLGDTNLKIKIIDNETISIDVPRQEAIYLTDTVRITLDNIEENIEDGYIMNLTIETYPFREQQVNKIGELSQEEIKVSLIAENNNIETHIYEPLLIEPINEEDAFTITNWGSEISLDMSSDDPQITEDDVAFIIPLNQRFGIVELGVSE